MATAKEIIKNGGSMGLLDHLAREVNAYNGSLEHLQVYDFDDEFFDIFFEGRPLEASRATFFGEIQNWNDEYIRFNGYGNLESLTDYQYQKELQEYSSDIIERALELLDEGHIDAEFIELEFADEVEA